MDFIYRSGIIWLMLITQLHAIGEPLTVGIQSYNPPFVAQGANQQAYGYDVAMMNDLCKIMQRTCQFRVMKFNKLLPAVAAKEIDTAVSSITITAERVKTVSFSTPYLLSATRFLSNQSPNLKQPFTLDLLNNKSFGVVAGTIFAQQINSMEIKNASIQSYDRIELLLEGLRNKEIDYILLDDLTALYWEANSSDAFTTVGPPFQYGLGLGIAVNQNNTNLLQAINKALLQYQDSDAYKANYNKYLQQF